MTQNNLGNALRTLGERESGMARLEEAVAAYREALEECTRERVPLDWAMTQNNLGMRFGLWVSGKRKQHSYARLSTVTSQRGKYSSPAPHTMPRSQEKGHNEIASFCGNKLIAEAQACLNQSAALRKRIDESSIPD